MTDRRTFLKSLGLLGGFVASPIHRLSRDRDRLQSIKADELPEGAELYEGFIILDEELSLPSFVRPAILLRVERCGMLEGDSSGTYVPQLTSADLGQTSRTSFAFPVHDLDTGVLDIRQMASQVVSDELGNIYEVRRVFAGSVSDSSEIATVVALTIRPDFPRPFPLWKSRPVEQNGPYVDYVKASYLPAPGLVSFTQTGFVAYWIERGALYTLSVEPGPNSTLLSRGEKGVLEVISLLQPD